MDPYDLEILKEGDHAVPLIKIVFALAASDPSLNVVRHPPTKNYPAVVYEIWCAGLSPDILGPIIPQETGIWDSLLQASYGWKELYKTTSKVSATLRQSASPGAARGAGHYSCWARRPPSQLFDQSQNCAIFFVYLSIDCNLHFPYELLWPTTTHAPISQAPSQYYPHRSPPYVEVINIPQHPRRRECSF
jgi:hypothetical protein